MTKKQQIDELQEELATYKVSYSGLQEEYSTLKAAYDNLEDSLLSAFAKNANYQMVTSLQDQVDRLEIDIQWYKDNQYNKLLDEARQRIIKLNSLIVDLTEKLLSK